MMKKTVAVIVAALIFIFTFASCQKKDANEPSAEPTVNSPYTDGNDETQPNVTQSTENSQTKATTSSAPSQTETTQKNKVVTYISENPDNSYICRVAEKYGSDKANLIAFIKINATTPGATVLEFSGKRDSNGDLIVMAEELKYVYDVLDGKEIKRASADGKNNDGYNKIAAKVAFMLGEKYLVPSIDEMRRERRYEDHFKN